MIRQVIHIDENACTGCGLCAKACHEGAIDIVDGKAKLMRENFCDGFGDCLPNCPAGAITFETREAPEYDQGAVLEAKKRKAVLSKLSRLRGTAPVKPASGCPGTVSETLPRFAAAPAAAADSGAVSELANWPPQIRLAPTAAPYYADCDLLIAADCSAFSRASFHADFMRGRTTLFGCPKLDPVDYSEKLAEILAGNSIRSILVVRMQVPCCGGLERAVRKAIDSSGKDIPCEVVTLTNKGGILA